MGLNAGGGSSTVNPAETAYMAASLYPLELKAFLKQIPTIMEYEQRYQPIYNALGNANTSATRTATLGDATRMGPGMMDLLRSYNPGQTQLLDTLTGQAQSQLGTNGALDAATRRAVQQNYRLGSSARGLGVGPGDAAMESFYETQTQEARRSANQNFASQVATQTANTYRDPFQYLLGMPTGVPVTPQITSGNTSDSMFGMMYNANAASQISNANQNAAQNAMAAQMIGSAAGSVMGGGSGVAGGAMKGGMCCFIFMEAYQGAMPGCIRRIRDKYYRRHPRIADGYKRMARWVVPLMQRSDLARRLVWWGMVGPATRYAMGIGNGKWQMADGKWQRAKRMSHFWLRTWAVLGKAESRK
jgi:hypothetical protein